MERRRAPKKKGRQGQIWLYALAGALFLMIFLLPLGQFLIEKNAEKTAGTVEVVEKPKLARLEIELTDTTLEEINEGGKATKYEGNRAKLIVDREVLEFEDVQIKGRGNSTWGNAKNPYQIKFSEKVDVLGLGKAKKWVLLANYYDDSNLRNATAFKVAEMVGEKFAPKGEYVELAVDGENLGLYYLVRKTEIGKNAVDLRSPEGILVELDNMHNGNEFCYRTIRNNCLTEKDMVDESRLGEVMHDFLTQFNLFEMAVEAGDFERVSEIIDIESFAEYYLVSEFAANPDAYASSFYLYKDGFDDKIHVGPVWDFDYSFGNKRWTWRSNDEILNSRYLNYATKGSDSPIALLIQMPEVQAEIRRVWQERLSGRVEELVWFYDEELEKILEAGVLDYERWSEEYVMSFPEGVEWVRNWILTRYEFLEEEFGDNGGDSEK